MENIVENALKILLGVNCIILVGMMAGLCFAKDRNKFSAENKFILMFIYFSGLSYNICYSLFLWFIDKSPLEIMPFIGAYLLLIISSLLFRSKNESNIH